MNQNKNQKSKKKISKGNSLQVQNPRILKSKLKWFTKKVRASFFAPFCLNASITIETAFVLPILLFVILSFLYFILIIHLQAEIQIVLNETARDIARYTYSYEQILNLSPQQEQKLQEEIELRDIIMQGFSSVYVLNQIKKELTEEWLDNSCIQGGSKGISILGDNLIQKDEMVDIVLRYYVNIPYLPENIFSFYCIQRVRIRAWTGFEKKEEGEGTQKEEIVFITETGSVFHRNKYCTYLNPAVKQTEKYTLETLRNYSGAIYYPCERCLNGKEPIEENLKIYITGSGNRYHITAECSSLKRTILEIPISEIGKRRPCSKCGETS